MRSMLRKLSILLTGFAVLYGMDGCAISTAPSPIQPMNTAFATPTLNTNTVPPSPTQIIDPTPTLLLPIPTAIPTLNEDDARAEILRLLSADDAHTFPSWWGLVPGQTRIIDMQNYLNSFSALAGIRLFDKQEGYILLAIPQSGDSSIDITFEFKGEREILDWLRVSIQRKIKVTNADGETSYEISWADPELAEITKPHSLSHVLSAYGPPTQVLLFTHQVALLNQPWPISLLVFYPEHGFMVEYVADGKGVPNSRNIAWCPSRAFPYFWFWSPSEGLTLEDIAPTIPVHQFNAESVDSSKFKTLEEVTGMNIDEFYSAHIADENTCIATPTELWPMPGQ